ncbi:MAG: ABC transporter permease subunit [Pseudomonadota bacterium]
MQRVLGALFLFLCVAPFAVVLAVSLGQPIDGAAWVWALTPGNYIRVFVGLDWPESTSFLYLQRLLWSFVYAAVASVLAVAFAFPFAWLMTRGSRRSQTVWLVFLLASLSLSEVFVVMGIDILLSNRSGLPMLFRETGLTQLLKDTGGFQWLREMGLASPRNVRFKTSVPATVGAMSYLVFPYAVILLYPAFSRIDASMMEAARTMGARPMTVMRTVVLPQVRVALIGAALLLFVFLLGAYVAVTVFADPARQTIAVSIYESVRGATLNAPFGAAQAIVLLVAAGAFLGLSNLLAKAGGPK